MAKNSSLQGRGGEAGGDFKGPMLFPSPPRSLSPVLGSESSLYCSSVWAPLLPTQVPRSYPRYLLPRPLQNLPPVAPPHPPLSHYAPLPHSFPRALALSPVLGSNSSLQQRVIHTHTHTHAHTTPSLPPPRLHPPSMAAPPIPLQALRLPPALPTAPIHTTATPLHIASHTTACRTTAAASAAASAALH
ncbi:unnamed protein product, partial [Closterium sp. NIES-54]